MQEKLDHLDDYYFTNRTSLDIVMYPSERYLGDGSSGLLKTYVPTAFMSLSLMVQPEYSDHTLTNSVSMQMKKKCLYPKIDYPFTKFKYFTFFFLPQAYLLDHDPLHFSTITIRSEAPSIELICVESMPGIRSVQFCMLLSPTQKPYLKIYMHSNDYSSWSKHFCHRHVYTIFTLTVSFITSHLIKCCITE